MSPFPSPPPRRHFVLSLLALLTLFPPLLLASSSFPLPTIAIAAVSANVTASFQHHLACALVPCGNGTGYQISCASVTNSSAQPHNYSYGSAGGESTPFSAVVAGDGYLCSSGPTVSRPMAMRWWNLKAGSKDSSKRVYWGKALSAVSGGGEYVCGIVEERIQCWRWSSGTVPDDVRFSAVAVGGGFVCGLVAGTGEVRCYGGGDAVGRVPKGSHAMLAAGERHACAVKAESGEVVCWGEAAAVAAASPSPRIVGRSVSSLAVGDTVTCVLWGNWTVACWPPQEAAPPESVAQHQFVALEAKGNVVCGVLMSDYSLVCWGPGVAAEAPGGVSKVFDRVLPGPCAPWGSCRCGVWSGSGPLCGGVGGAAVCYPCGYSAPMMAQVPTSNSSTSSSHSGGKRRPSDLVIALVSVGIGSGVLAATAAVAVVYCLRRRRSSGSHDSGRIHAEPNGTAPRVERRLDALLSKGPNTTVEQFPLVALRAATGGFSPSHRIGSGSFGTVYRASLPDGREVAIKRAERRNPGAASSSTAARRVKDHEAAFVSELALLSRVNHKNLVRLLGFCADGGERILVYEYMPNGTLHDHLHKRPAPLSPPLASWPARLRLALGAARGIEYMHTYAVPPIIHRDIKSPNILLDAAWTTKVSDFGLSLLNDLGSGGGDGDGNAGDVVDDEPCMTAGTVGYMDPEYYRLQHLTDKSDVYSFGVVLLELLSGCKVIQRFEGSGTPKNVVDVTVPHIEADRVHRVLDARLPLPTPGEMEAVAYVGYLAADCVRPAGRDRPTMSEVVSVLERAVAACEENDGGGEAVLSRSCTDGSTTT
ncbi:Serine/threonine-protein kinase-like protein CCR4 [Dichanthelium oligosanthes]|uniref:Serine/threonine-protein kinase-like protein CCR4 n=1 Tax=Dichanthelium oligosanthes TaxID=888268 RepID=A0A1E5V5X4_9POAL|nr:Serine/threonine-protein kinase-like protein CCR4 [Dichanthelium oligosanthes]